MKHVVAGAVLIASMIAATPASAEGPLTPLRPLSSSSADRQWVEPPPTAAAAVPPPAAPAAPAAAAAPPPAAPVAPTLAAAEPEPRADQAGDGRPPRRVQKRAAHRTAGTASGLNRRELAHIRSGRGYYSYSGAYGGHPFGPSPSGGSVD